MTIVDGMDDFSELVLAFKSARSALEQRKLETYPNGTVVYVECDRVCLRTTRPQDWPNWIKREKKLI